METVVTTITEIITSITEVITTTTSTVTETATVNSTGTVNLNWGSGFLFILGIIIICFGANLLKNRNELTKSAALGFALIYSGLFFCLFGFFQASAMSLSDVFMVWGSLILAIIAAATFDANKNLNKKAVEREENYRKNEEKYRKESLETEQRYRSESLEREQKYRVEVQKREERERKERFEKEERERKDRALIEIIDWANRLQTIVASFKYKSIDTLHDILSEIRSIKAEQIALITISKNIFPQLTDFILLKRPDDFVPKKPSENPLDIFITDIEELSKKVPDLKTEEIIKGSPMTLVESLYLDEEFSHLGIKAIETVLINDALIKVIENASDLRAEILNSISKPT